MAPAYPQTIPAEYAVNDDLKRAYLRGWNLGHGVARHYVPRLGETYWTPRNGRVTATAENIRDVHLELCFAAAENSRSYPPFEFKACAEVLWAAFEQGTATPIHADLREYTDDDYGINERA
jgi:hypothetical protein